MSKFEVAIYRPVADITVCYVEIEAETAEAAEAAAMALDHSDLEFTWLACTDSLEETTAEVKRIVNTGV